MFKLFYKKIVCWCFAILQVGYKEDQIRHKIFVNYSNNQSFRLFCFALIKVLLVLNVIIVYIIPCSNFLNSLSETSTNISNWDMFFIQLFLFTCRIFNHTKTKVFRSNFNLISNRCLETWPNTLCDSKYKIYK